MTASSLDRRNLTVTPVGDLEVSASRSFRAPRPLVFEAMTRAERMRRWMGPRALTVEYFESDPRPGGKYRFAHRSPDGSVHPFWGEYLEVVPPELVVHTEVYDIAPYRDHPSLNTITFEEADGWTTVTILSRFETRDFRDGYLASGVERGMREGYERLDELLEEMSVNASTVPQDALVISRSFAAPRDLVFKAWTEPERLAQWWAPRGFTVEVGSLDLRPGGRFHYRQVGPNDLVMWGLFNYREVSPPERLVWVSAFSDPEGNITKAPFFPEWPLEILNTLELSEQDGRTKLTLRGGPINATPTQVDAFLNNRPGMEQGFKGTFDQLEAYLARAQEEA